MTARDSRIQKGESMQQDLSNARIIEWESTEERGFEFTRLVEVAHVARREARGATFREGGTYYTEQQAAELGARVVAEFPRPSLAEVVGDAPAFLFENCGESYIAYRVSPVTWVVRRGKAVESFTHSYLGLDAFQADYHKLDPASVVPLVAREVVT